MVAVTQNYSPSLSKKTCFHGAITAYIPFLFFVPLTSIDFGFFFFFVFLSLSNVLPILFEYVGGMFLSESIMK